MLVFITLNDFDLWNISGHNPLPGLSMLKISNTKAPLLNVSYQSYLRLLVAAKTYDY